MKDSLRVSVIVPVFNSARTISRALDSILAQSRPADEIVVVDDGSSDDLEAALSKYGGRVTLHRKTNGGVAEARNVGVDRSTEDLIAFLDADDYWEPGALAHQVSVFEQHQQVGLGCGLYYEQVPGQPRRAGPGYRDQLFNRPFSPRGEDAVLQATRTSTPTVVVRRSVLGADRFRAGLQSAEDRDLWIRVIARTQVYMTSARLATVVLEPGSLSRSNADRDARNMLTVLHSYPELLPGHSMRRWEARVYRGWASEYLHQRDGRAALPPGVQRLRREPWSLEAMWVVLRALSLAAREHARPGDQAVPSSRP